jgi:glycosyltransferase involved in cell wall biosynthesis
MECSIVAAVNDEAVLNNCLLRSPDVQAAADLIIERGHSSASAAYNAGIDKAKADLLIFVHQDVYFPPGWLGQLERALQQLDRQDRNWGVVGAWGPVRRDGRSGPNVGHIYWTGIGVPAGKHFDGGVEVETLDEVILILRKSSGLRFDPALPGFHMYGTDICLEAESRGRKNYVVSALCVHNTSLYAMLPKAFWKSYRFVRRKWRSRLPIKTPCVEITRWGWPAAYIKLTRARDMLIGRSQRRERAPDPIEVYKRLVS